VEDGAIGAGATDLRAAGMPDLVAVRPNPVAGRPDPVVVRPDLVVGRPDPAASDCSGGAPWMDSLGLSMRIRKPIQKPKRIIN